MLFANVCARLFFFLLWRTFVLGLAFFVFLVSSWCLVHMESSSLAGLLLCTRLGHDQEQSVNWPRMWSLMIMDEWISYSSSATEKVC